MGLNDQQFFDLAIKMATGQAGPSEQAELDRLLEARPELREEYRQLKTEAALARSIIPLLKAMESATPELPAYALPRLQSALRETFPRTLPPPARRLTIYAFCRWMMGAVVAAGLVFVLLRVFWGGKTGPAAPIIQVALLDSTGPMRGPEPDPGEVLTRHYLGIKIQAFSNAPALTQWLGQWPDSHEAAVVKVTCDLDSGLVRLTSRFPFPGMDAPSIAPAVEPAGPYEKTFALRPGEPLATSLSAVEAFIATNRFLK